MTAQVGYLGRLTSRDAGLTPLQPPRPLFASAAYPLEGTLDLSPGLSPGSGLADVLAGDAAEADADGFPLADAAAQEWAGLPAGPRIAARDGALAPSAPVPEGLPAPPASPAPPALPASPGSGLPALGPSGPGLSGPVTVGPGPGTVGPASRGGAGPARAGDRAPATADLSVPTDGSRTPDRKPGALAAGSSTPGTGSSAPGMVLPSAMTVSSSVTPSRGAPSPVTLPPVAPVGTPGRPELASRGRAAQSPALDWLWGAPVELPPAPATLLEPGRAPVTGVTGPSLAGGTVRPPASDGPGAPGTPEGRDAGGGGQAGVARDLLPPSAPALRSDEHAGTGGARREPPGRVTIGVIEVTVVPPARPARGAGEPRPAAQVPAVAPRAASWLAEAGAARLRDGLRRWYGIAQG